MVFSLGVNIFNCHIQYRLAYRIGSISALPCKLSIMRIQRFYPSTAVAFQLFHQVRHRTITRQCAHHMHVVFYTSYT